METVPADSGQSVVDVSALSSELAALKVGIDQCLETLISEYGSFPGNPLNMQQALKDAALGGGKRIRAAISLMMTAGLGGDASAAMMPACAVELIHAYSLVHDDLPAMDDDDMRRGKPSCHIAYGVPAAILVGDALQALAFEAIALAPQDILRADQLLACVKCLALAAGARGMVGGQAFDIATFGNDVSQDTTDNAAGAHAVAKDDIITCHRGKTAAMFRAATQIGAICAGVDASLIEQSARFGESIGMAFQFADDRLDDDFSNHDDWLLSSCESYCDEAASAIVALGLSGDNSAIRMLPDMIRLRGRKTAVSD